MTADTLDDIAESIGTITEEREEDHDNKESEDVEAFDVEEYRRNLDEYDGGWNTGE